MNDYKSKLDMSVGGFIALLVVFTASLFDTVSTTYLAALLIFLFIEILWYLKKCS